MLTPLVFPTIDPVALEIGPLVIRWYALAYIAGLVLGWRFCVLLARRPPVLADSASLDDLLLYVTLGVILGGRLGYVLFYKPAFFLANPAEVVMIWHGGMSFHGGLLGVTTAILFFARNRGIPALVVADVAAAAAPIGLFFGRVANFINGELFGRVSDLPWAMVFPQGGPLPRHPSQLYEAALEGLVLFILVGTVAWVTGARHRPGLVFGLFLAGYGLVRSGVELVREPDRHLGFLFESATMGQVLSAPMVAAGILLIIVACRRPGRSPGNSNV